MNERAVITVDTLVLPTGMDPIEHQDLISTFALHVRWQGDRGWTVTDWSPDRRLSVKDRNWTWYVAKRNRRYYYFPTYDAALRAAHDVVDDHTVNGLTWQQWKNGCDEDQHP